MERRRDMSVRAFERRITERFTCSRNAERLHVGLVRLSWIVGLGRLDAPSKRVI